MGHVARDEALAHAGSLVAAVNVPVSGDFENGYGDDPDTCVTTVRLAYEVGLAGISNEDTALPSPTAYERNFAIERIRAASAAARALPGDFVLVARADGVMNGQYDFDEALTRLAGYEAADADCVYVPLPVTLDDQARHSSRHKRCCQRHVSAGGFFDVVAIDIWQCGGCVVESIGRPFVWHNRERFDGWALGRVG